MATFKYRVNKGAWQTVQLTAEDCTAVTLTNTETYPVPQEYVGTYVKSGITVNQCDQYSDLVVWYCSANGKTLYTQTPYDLWYMYFTDYVDPWGEVSEGEDYIYVNGYGTLEERNLTYIMNNPQKVSLNLNAGDEVEIICASRALFDDTMSASTSETKYGHVIRYNANFPHEVFGNINSASYGEGFDSQNATFDGFDEVDYYNSGQYAWHVIGDSISEDTGLFSGQWQNLISAKNLLIYNLGENSFCAKKLFNQCENLLEAPEFLPDISLPQAKTNWPWGETEIGCYENMFSNCYKLRTAPKLPATSVTAYAYKEMFSSCGHLVAAPELPATSLGYQCYASMFYDCSEMTKAPKILPATTLEDYCYSSMFNYCQSITKAPILPATDLSNCYMPYSSMFTCCFNLKDAPELPATSLTDYCYDSMFTSCSSLKTIPDLPAMTLANYCYYNMFNNCSGLTGVSILPATTLASHCYASMFAACRNLQTPPALPATNLADHCYSYMFQGCYSLKTVPELPAANLADYCYYGMFSSCSGLTSTKPLTATTLKNSCYYYMFAGCKSLTTPPALPATTLTSQCYGYMFRGCTSLTTAPVLSTTLLSTGCYTHMFEGCTSLTTAPVLPTKTPPQSAYTAMFSGCSSLNYVKALFTTTPGGDYATKYRTKDWLAGVSATGTFVKNASATWSLSGPSGIPNGWTVETASE